MPPVPAAGVAAHPRVLVIDDEPLIRAFLRTVLTHAGYGVEVAENGAAALRLLAETLPPDLIILDLAMPELDGRAFREIQRRRPELAGIPVVICSGEGPVADAELFRGCNWIEKPISVSGMLAAVREGLVPR